MRILFGIVFVVSILFGANISMEDMQKYQQYKTLIDDKSVIDKPEKDIKEAIAENNIDDKIDKEIKNKVENLFKYDQENIELKRYGESFFQNKNLINSTLIPTSNNYMLNNGDTIFINTYGSKKNKIYELKVDNNGNISIPNIGLIKIGSLKLSEVKTVISNIITKSFPKTKVIVDISGYSSIQVVVTGNVKVPGIYNLNSFSTIKDALITANGLLDIGSYRDIDVIRGGKKIYTFDLYKLLNKTKNTNDITLRSGDIVAVNFTKKSISLSGKVKYQAIYELRDKESFQDLMKYSGGFSFDATKNSIKLIRYDNDKKIKTYILSKNNFFAMKPKDGDKVEIFNNLELKEKPYIYVHGKVLDKEVKYNYFDGMTLSQLFDMITFRSEIIDDKDNKSRESLFVDKNNIKIIRNNDDDKRVFLVSLDEQFILKPYDEVEFFNYFDTNPRFSVSIKGEVYKDGKIFIDKDTNFKEFIKLAGGLTQKAYKKEFELVRYYIVDEQRVRDITKVNFKYAYENNFKLHDNDEINIFTIPNWNDIKKVTIKGEVKFPGTYTIESGEKLSNIIQRAGGFTKEAFIEGAMFTRESIRLNEEKRMKEAMFKLKQQVSFSATNAKEAGAVKSSTSELVATINLLDKQLEEYKALGRLIVYLNKDIEVFKKSQFDIRLAHEDTLIVPSYDDTISVYGEVMSPNSFVYDNKLQSYDYIKKAGGMTQRADEDSIYLVMANGEAKNLVTTYLFGSNENKIPVGSTIVIPMQVDKVSNILLWKEVSQIVYQLAITAASLTTVGAL